MQMTAVVEAPGHDEWRRLKTLVLDSVSSPHTRRLYNLALNNFIAWYTCQARSGFSKATVSAWRASLETRGLGSSSINVRLSAIRKLAAEAADNGLLAPELAAGILRIRGAKSKGVRMGNWLSLRQAQSLLRATDIATLKGLRDRAMLAVLLGCGLRRSEVAGLTLAHIHERDRRWCIVDLKGKHGRVRTAPMPAWVKAAVDGWTRRLVLRTDLHLGQVGMGRASPRYSGNDGGGDESEGGLDRQKELVTNSSRSTPLWLAQKPGFCDSSLLAHPS